jgi:hypothetical protein
VSAVSYQPIFTDGRTDLEITFLATRLSAEGSGMAMWLIYNSLKVLLSMNFKNVYVQSCPQPINFYHKLGAYPFP